jgi:hypothetical protein
MAAAAADGTDDERVRLVSCGAFDLRKREGDGDGKLSSLLWFFEALYLL